MVVNKEPKSLLLVESLKGRHISMIVGLKANKEFGSIQLMLLRNWFATIEKNFPRIFAARNPYSYLALENTKPIAVLTLEPVNLRSTCWSLSQPELLENPVIYSKKDIFHSLLKYALEFGNIKSPHWLIECSVSNTIELAIAREFGFQPLKIYNCWTPPKSNEKPSNKSTVDGLNNEYEWQEINNLNASSLLKLQQLWESSHLRQITSKTSLELLESSHTYSRVLMSKSRKDNAIAGLIFKGSNKDTIIIELVRDVAWDERLLFNIQLILKELNVKSANRKLHIHTSNEDEKLTELLSKFGWKNTNEIILLGRSLWRRQENKKLSIGAKKLESMLGSLNPQTPPLPTPTLVPR